MRNLRLLLSFSLAFSTFSALAIATAPAADAPALLAALPGTWNCSGQGPNGSATSVYTFTAVNPDTVEYNGKMTSGKYAGRTSAGVWHYDAQKHQYAAMGAGRTWGVSLGNAAPDAMTLNLTDTYPPDDPNNGTATFHLTSNSIAITSDWKQDGKPAHSSTTCKKE